MASSPAPESRLGRDDDGRELEAASSPAPLTGRLVALGPVGSMEWML